MPEVSEEYPYVVQPITKACATGLLDEQKESAWSWTHLFYLDFLSPTIRHQVNGNARYRGSKDITAPNYYHQVDYSYNYGLCGGLLTLEGFFL